MGMGVRVGLKSPQALLVKDGKRYKDTICGGLVRTKDSLEIQAAPFLSNNVP